MISYYYFNKTRYSGFYLFLVRKSECLLCSSKFENQNDLLNHYVTCHNINENNWFFQKLFQIRDKAVLRQCIKCDEFLTTNKHKAVDNFQSTMKTVKVFHLKKYLLIF